MPSTSELRHRDLKRDALKWSIVIGVVLFLFSAPAVLLALGALRYTGDRLRRLDFAGLTVASTLVFATNAAGWAKDWFWWLGGLVGLGDTSRLAVPVVPLLLLTVGILGILGVVLGSSKAMSVSKCASLKKAFVKTPDIESETIVPSKKELERIRIAGPPDGVVGFDPQAHSVATEEVGNRRFSFSVDRSGTPVWLTEREVGMHGLFLGSTGSGKTVAMQGFAAALMDLGWSGMVIDCKEDTNGFRNFLETYAREHALPYQELNISTPGGFWFNALSGMGPDEARDAILSLVRFDDDYWKNVNTKVLGQTITLMFAAHQIDPDQFPEPSVYDVGRILGSGNLPASTKKMRAVVKLHGGSIGFNVADEEMSALISPSQDEQKSAVGFGAKLTNIYETSAGRESLRPDAAGTRRVIDVTAPGLTYFGLDMQGKQDLAKMVSAAVLQRMSVYAAERATGHATDNRPRFIIVDEANRVSRDAVKNMLSRARSAGLAVFLATQSGLDWVDADGDDWEVMAQNANISVIMSQNSPESAEMMAEFIGTEERLGISAQILEGSLGQGGQVKKERAYRVRPEELRALTIGEAILRVSKPTERTQWMTVAVRSPERLAGRRS